MLFHEGPKPAIGTTPSRGLKALAIFRDRLPQYEWSVTAAPDESVYGTDWWRRRAWAKTSWGETENASSSQSLRHTDAEVLYGEAAGVHGGFRHRVPAGDRTKHPVASQELSAGIGSPGFRGYRADDLYFRGRDHHV